MYIKKLSLKNFKCFENKEFNFDNLNFISGTNGSGKSTIIEAIIFALFGYTSQSLLSDIPTRNRSKSCTSELLIEENKHLYRIIRQFPLKLSIFKDNIPLKLSTAEANRYIIDTFGDRQSFFYFRLLDAYNQETNFLEQGQVTLKKIIFAGTDEYFNNIRTKLTNIKYERERLNKDKLVIYKHYPSEKRLNILIANLEEINNSLACIDKELNEYENDLRENKIQFSNNETKIAYLKKQIENIDTIKFPKEIQLQTIEKQISNNNLKIEQENKQIENYRTDSYVVADKNICYACKRPLESHTAQDLIKEREEKINRCLSNIQNYNDKNKILQEQANILKKEVIKEKEQKLQEYKEEISNLENIQKGIKEEIQINTELKEQFQSQKQALFNKKEKIQTLKMKLETRLQQREFIYTENDVLIAKKALEELDKLSSFYLVETVSSLEPIINSVLTKINFSVKFDVDTKGKFNIILTKNNVQYKYKDLSTGERLILQIGIKIALLLQNNKSGILIADEGLGSLSEENMNHVLDLFENLPLQLIFVRHGYVPLNKNIKIINLGEINEKT